MNANESNRSPHPGVWKIHALGEDYPIPTAVEIKVIGRGGLGNTDLSALWSRPRCRQETRKTVESAPRQTEVVKP
jgi:hypothetical protein